MMPCAGFTAYENGSSAASISLIVLTCFLRLLAEKLIIAPKRGNLDPIQLNRQ